jgi:hypothetical protein
MLNLDGLNISRSGVLASFVPEQRYSLDIFEHILIKSNDVELQLEHDFPDLSIPLLRANIKRFERSDFNVKLAFNFEDAGQQSEDLSNLLQEYSKRMNASDRL